MLTQEHIPTSLRPMVKAQVPRNSRSPRSSQPAGQFGDRLEAFLYAVHSRRSSILRISLALVFVWFGGLKIFGVSPAFGLVENTVFWFPAEIFVPLLGLAEVLIGAGLAFGRYMRWVLLLLAGHMLATFSPFLIIPGACFESAPFELTLEGQYIVKNLVFIAVGMVLAADGLVRRKKSFGTAFNSSGQSKNSSLDSI